MKYNPYTASSLGTFAQCPRKFKYYKIDKIKVPRVRTDALVRGELIHLFLEHNEDDLSKQIPRIKYLQKRDKGITKELVKESYDIFTRYKNGPIGKKYLSLKSLGRELKIALKIENKTLVPCKYDDPDAIYRGLIDAVFVDTDTDKVYIIDWKSGKDKSTGTYKQTPDQLLYYASWYFTNFPVDNISIVYAFVEHNTELKYELTRDRVKHYNKLLLKNISEVEKEQQFPKEESPLCDYCDYQDHCMKDF